jgi:SAM-dependent methyltransferase
MRMIRTLAPKISPRFTWPQDTWERHTIVARLVRTRGTVLDVGGRPGELAAVLPECRVTALNVDSPADVIAGGDELPFPDDAFDVVTSIDVLEHLPADSRRRHLEELVRVARAQAVACCPLGTEAHVRAERELAEWHVSTTGEPHRFLEEHLVNGLPSEPELRELVADLPFAFELYFHGDFRTTGSVFRASAGRRVLRYGFALLRRRDTTLSSVPGPFTNRAFLSGHAS